MGGAGASGSSRCFLEHHLSPRSPQGAGAVPAISAAWWLLCTKRKHGAACLQSLRMLPGLPELCVLLFQHSSFSSCSLRVTPVFSLPLSIHDQVTGCLSSAPGLSPSHISACSSWLSPLAPCPKQLRWDRALASGYNDIQFPSGEGEAEAGDSAEEARS